MIRQSDTFEVRRVQRLAAAPGTDATDTAVVFDIGGGAYQGGLLRPNQLVGLLQQLLARTSSLIGGGGVSQRLEPLVKAPARVQALASSTGHTKEDALVVLALGGCHLTFEVERRSLVAFARAVIAEADDGRRMH